MLSTPSEGYRRKVMSLSVDGYGSFSGEQMVMGSPNSPASPHGHQYLPNYLLGETSVLSPGGNLLQVNSPSPLKSSQRGGSLTSPSNIGSTPKSEAQDFNKCRSKRPDVLRPKERVGAPPTKSLLSSPPGPSVGSFSTPSQIPYTQSKASHAPASITSTPAPPISSLSQSTMEVIGGGANDLSHSFMSAQRIPPSPAQADPFYTQGENITSDDLLDETWVTVFGFPPAAASFILQQFSQYGNILKYKVAVEGNWMHLHYQSKLQAKKALSKNGKVFGNSVMVGVLPCIDKLLMEDDRENSFLDSSNFIQTGNQSMQSSFSSSTSGKNPPIRPLTAAYRSARSDTEVLRNNQAPQKNNTFVSKAMEYMFGW